MKIIKINNRRAYLSSVTYLSPVTYLSTTAISSMDKKLADLKEEKQSLQSDLDLIKPAIKAASKITNGEIPSPEDNECLSELKDNYPVFFDSEGEEEGASSLLNKIMGVKRYVTKELKTNKNSIRSLKDKGKIKEDTSAPNEPTIENQEEAKKFTIERGESSKRKVDEISDSEDSTSSKKSRPSTKELIDELPVLPYNPFDDLGTD